MDRKLLWVAQKGMLAAALYVTVIGDVPWMHDVVAAFVWCSLAATLWSSPRHASPRSPGSGGVSLPAAMAFDVAVLGSMFLAHWYWTAFAYAASCGLLALAQARAARL